MPSSVWSRSRRITASQSASVRSGTASSARAGGLLCFTRATPFGSPAGLPIFLVFDEEAFVRFERASLAPELFEIDGGDGVVVQNVIRAQIAQRDFALGPSELLPLSRQQAVETLFERAHRHRHAAHTLANLRGRRLVAGHGCTFLGKGSAVAAAADRDCSISGYARALGQSGGLIPDRLLLSLSLLASPGSQP